MPESRSALFNCVLPPGIEEALRKEGIDPRQAWMCVPTDLNLAGSYEAVYLMADSDSLYTAGAVDGQPSAIRQRLSRASVKDIRTRQGVGGGFLEAKVDGIWVEILAYSNVRADIFHKTAKKLDLWREAKPVAVGPEDDVDPRKCPKCNLTLQFRGDICPRCVDRGRVMVRVLKLMRPYAGKATFMMVLVLAAIGMSLVPQHLIKLMTDFVLAPEQARNPVLPGDKAALWLLGLVGAYFGVNILGALVNMLSGRLGSFIGTQIAYDMRARVFDHLTKLSVGYFDRYNVGQLMTRVATDTEQMRGFVQQLTGGFLAQIIQVVAVGVMLFSLNWKLACYTLLPAPFVIASILFFWKRIYPRYYKVWDANSKMHGVLNTILSGVRVVKAFGQEIREQGRFGRSAGYVRDSARGVEYTVTIFNPAIGLLFQMGGLIVWFVGGQMVLHDKGMAGTADSRFTLGALMAFLGYLGMFYQPLGQLTQLTNWLTGFLTATQRTFEILDTPPQITEIEDPKRLATVQGAIRFENVAFGYNRHEPIIKNISLAIQPGEHIGVVGKSGSGKTTLINLLARFYDVDEGRVFIDGHDIRDLNMDDLRKAVGIVLQEPFLFRGTISTNISYGRRDITPEQIMEAAKIANAHDFIMRHPLGYDTYIGERGAGLSGGERQRVSIARAILYDPAILVLDEATSNVDTESEQLIQEAIARVTEGRTTIAIAHRLSTLKKCDRIFVIDKGAVIEQGSHDALMTLGGVYHRLVKIQTELSREANVDTLTLVKK